MQRMPVSNYKEDKIKYNGMVNFTDDSFGMVCYNDKANAFRWRASERMFAIRGNIITI